MSIPTPVQTIQEFHRNKSTAFITNYNHEQLSFNPCRVLPSINKICDFCTEIIHYFNL